MVGFSRKNQRLLLSFQNNNKATGIYWQRRCAIDSKQGTHIYKIISIHFLIFHNFTKIKMKSFECPMSIRNYENINNPWNIRPMVNESFVPSTQGASAHIILKIVVFKGITNIRRKFCYSHATDTQ